MVELGSCAVSVVPALEVCGDVSGMLVTELETISFAPASTAFVTGATGVDVTEIVLASAVAAFSEASV